MSSEDSRSRLAHWIGTCAAITLGIFIGLGIFGTLVVLWLMGTW